MSRARTIANFGVVTANATELNLLDNVTNIATQAELDAIPIFNDNVIQTNIALLAFKTAVNGSLAKYSLQDQIVDEFETEAGIDTGTSTNETLASGGYSGTEHFNYFGDDSDGTVTTSGNAEDYQ